MKIDKIYNGEALEVMKEFPDESIDCCITSPPYWGLRDYGNENQLGLEKDFKEYINKLCNIFDEVKRVLKKEGTCWVNLGDTYGGSGKGAGGQSEKNSKEAWRFENAPKLNGFDKCLCQIPSRFAIEMTDRGWILRNEIIWYKPNCMPASVEDRFTVDFEKMFFFVKNKKYYFEQQFDKSIDKQNRILTDNAEWKTSFIKQGKYSTGRLENWRDKEYGCPKDGRNKRTVWKIETQPYAEAHFAVFPQKLIETPIKAGCPENGIVLDPFMGSGTTGIVAKKQGRKYIGIELNADYIKLANKRIYNYLDGNLLEYIA